MDPKLKEYFSEFGKQMSTIFATQISEAIKEVRSPLPASTSNTDLTTEKSTEGNPNNNYVFNQFDATVETFTRYIERLENYLTLVNIRTEEKKAKILLNCIDAKHYSLLSRLVAPKSVSEIKYKEIIELLTEHLCPKPNPIVERHKLLSTMQKQSESISSYIAELKQYIATCELRCKDCEAENPELLLQPQFIRGISNEHIRE